MTTLLDLDQITTGKDGKLNMQVRKANGTVESVFLAQVNTWSAQVEIIDTDYQAAYDFGVGKVATGGRFVLSITEAVVTDAPFLTAIIDGLRPPANGTRRPHLIYFDFSGSMDSADDGGQRGKYSMTKCKPTGTFDFFKIQPGAPNDRTWNFVSRVIPRIDQRLLASAP